MQNKSDLRQSLEKQEAPPRTVRLYSRYFEGYTEYRETKPDGGKGKIIRLYTADYYVCDLSATKRRLLKGIYALAFLAVLAAFLLGSLIWFDGRGTWPVAAIDAVCVIFVGLLGFAVGNNLCSGKNLTIYLFQVSSKSLIWRSAAAAAALAAGAVTVILAVVLQKLPLTQEAWQTAALYAIAALGALLILMLERSLSYKRVPSGNKVPKETDGSGEGIETTKKDAET